VHRRAGGQEHVRGILFGHQLQEVADIHAQWFPNKQQRLVASPPQASDNGRARDFSLRLP
ncbi:hypothetical protein, partial [Xanthomonas perforans]|uniref:hypothetical protein n=1 Tax=Xanthomonas perforans TaxID=442694 RepID=UPI0019D0F073